MKINLFEIDKVIFLAAAGLSLSQSGFASQTPKVAVIVSAGDLNSLEKSMKQLENQAADTYGRLGFKVILIGGVERSGEPLTAQTLTETLGSLSGVQDLRLDFIGHGNVAKSTRDDSSDIKVSRERVRQSFDPESLNNADRLVWFAANRQNLDQSAGYYSSKAEQWTGVKSEPQRPVTHRDVEAALSRFRERNPQGVATVNLLNCFSGSVAQRLRKTPNTIVFANSPHNTVALDLAQLVAEEEHESVARSAYLGSLNGLQRYYAAIGGDYRFDAIGATTEKAHGLLSFGAVRAWANRQVASRLRDEPTLVGMVGRSPAFESAIGWCEEGRPGRLQAPRSDPMLDTDKTIVHLAGSLRAESKELEGRVKYAENTPDRIEPETKRLQKSKESFHRCEADPAAAESTTERRVAEYESRVAAWSYQRARFSADPKAPFRYLLASLASAAADPGKSAAIRDRFMKSIENDLRNLERKDLPMQRWGSIEKLIADFKAGRTTSEWIVERVKLQLADIRKACVDGDFEKSPCYPEKLLVVRDLSILLLGIGGPVPAKVKDSILVKSCQDGAGFGCSYLSDTNSEFLVHELERYWFPKPRRPAEIRRCGTWFGDGLDWIEFQKTQANSKMDKECIEDFILHAPDSEFSNLERLQKLGARDARGYTDVGSKSDVEKRHDSREVKK